ncbi:MAG: diaminopimelate epimerase [Acidobacteria bacterium]|nr:diaminopimelate epimerase [Acidobacteriota bacterium]
MKFSKFEGLGNDFLIVREEALPPGVPTGELARAVCHRKVGVGADGLLILGPARSAGARLRMQVWNADGTEAEISGNGLRCAAAWSLMEGRETVDPICLETRAGDRRLWLTKRDGASLRLRADMGRPILRSDQIPAALVPSREICVDIPIEVSGQAVRTTLTSMGNPHCSIFVEDFEAVDWRGLGPPIEMHPLFPRRTNVEFIRVLDRSRIEVRFWERGVGETCSSGTGACAAAVAAMLQDRVDRAVIVKTEGGEMRIEWPQDGPVILEAGASFVFEGNWPPMVGRRGGLDG